MLWSSSHKLSPNPTNLHMPQSLIVPPDSATRSTSKTSENDANRPAKSQMVGSLLSAYDDHDDESDMDAEPAAAPEATADAGAVGAGGAVGAVPTVESRSWSNWEDMWLNCRYLQIGSLGPGALRLSVLLQRRNVYMLRLWSYGIRRCLDLIWSDVPGCLVQDRDPYMFPMPHLPYQMLVLRSDPRCRHGIVMGKQPEELVSAWPRDLSQYPPGYPPAQPPGCCTQRCHCMDGTKRP